MSASIRDFSHHVSKIEDELVNLQFSIRFPDGSLRHSVDNIRTTLVVSNSTLFRPLIQPTVENVSSMEFDFDFEAEHFVEIFFHSLALIFFSVFNRWETFPDGGGVKRG